MEKIQATEIELDVVEGHVYLLFQDYDGCVWDKADRMLQQITGRVRFVVTFSNGERYEGHCTPSVDTMLADVIRMRLAIAGSDGDLAPQATKFLETYDLPG